MTIHQLFSARGVEQYRIEFHKGICECREFIDKLVKHDSSINFHKWEIEMGKGMYVFKTFIYKVGKRKCVTVFLIHPETASFDIASIETKDTQGGRQYLRRFVQSFHFIASKRQRGDAR